MAWLVVLEPLAIRLEAGHLTHDRLTVRGRRDTGGARLGQPAGRS